MLALLTLAPLTFLFINLFKSQTEIVDNPLALPVNWTLAYLVIGNAEDKTLTLKWYYAKQIVSQYGNLWELIFPAVLISILPIVILFLFLQKQVMSGMTDGAVKGESYLYNIRSVLNGKNLVERKCGISNLSAQLL